MLPLNLPSRCACAAAALVAALAAPAVAGAHGRGATVALDYRLTLDVTRLPGLHASVLDGDRALRLRVDRGTRVVVLGDLGEPMLRLGDGVLVNRASPTAQANRLISRTGRGWQRVSSGTSYAWHDHRLAPPPYVAGAYGPVAQWTVPIRLDGRRAAIGGSFWRVRRPRSWLWVGAAALAAAAAVLALRLRPGLGVVVTVAAGLVAGGGALVAEAAFSLRDSPSGRVAWVPIVVAVLVAVLAGWLVAVGRGARRAYVAGAIGAGVAALSLSWLGVFFHGVVVAALPGAAVRLACAAAFTAGAVSLVGALTVPAEDE